MSYQLISWQVMNDAVFLMNLWVSSDYREKAKRCFQFNISPTHHILIGLAEGARDWREILRASVNRQINSQIPLLAAFNFFTHSTHDIFFNGHCMWSKVATHLHPLYDSRFRSLSNHSNVQYIGSFIELPYIVPNVIQKCNPRRSCVLFFSLNLPTVEFGKRPIFLWILYS